MKLPSYIPKLGWLAQLYTRVVMAVPFGPKENLNEWAWELKIVFRNIAVVR